MLYRILRFLATSLAIFVLIALGLIAWPAPQSPGARGIASRELDQRVVAGSESAGRKADVELSAFTARDGARRLYRLHPGAGADVLVFLHGSSADGRYLTPLASHVATTSGVSVVALDMRGHGLEPVRRGDVAAVDQQEADIADLMAHLRRSRPQGRFFLGGHSIGGGLAIRYAAGTFQPAPDRLLLLAPYIHRKAPTARSDSGGWASPHITRFAGIEMLHWLGVRSFDHLPVLRFEVPARARDGAETDTYSWRLFRSVTPRDDWRGDIARLTMPTLVLAAGRDVIFNAEGYAAAFSGAKSARVEVLPELGHFELVDPNAVGSLIGRWMEPSL